MILPKFYYQVGRESDRALIMLWMRRIKPEMQEFVSSKYELKFKRGGRDVANQWLEKYSNEFGQEPSPGFDKFAIRIEKLIMASRVKRGVNKK